MMDESTAYQWAWDCLKPFNGQNIEHHKIEQVIDKIVSAIIQAYKDGSSG